MIGIQQPHKMIQNSKTDLFEVSKGIDLKCQIKHDIFKYPTVFCWSKVNKNWTGSLEVGLTWHISVTWHICIIYKWS